MVHRWCTGGVEAAGCACWRDGWPTHTHVPLGMRQASASFEPVVPSKAAGCSQTPPGPAALLESLH